MFYKKNKKNLYYICCFLRVSQVRKIVVLQTPRIESHNMILRKPIRFEMYILSWPSLYPTLYNPVDLMSPYTLQRR